MLSNESARQLLGLLEVGAGNEPRGTQGIAGLPIREWGGADPVITTRVYTDRRD